MSFPRSERPAVETASQTASVPPSTHQLSDGVGPGGGASPLSPDTPPGQRVGGQARLSDAMSPRLAPSMNIRPTDLADPVDPAFSQGFANPLQGERDGGQHTGETSEAGPGDQGQVQSGDNLTPSGVPLLQQQEDHEEDRIPKRPAVSVRDSTGEGLGDADEVTGHPDRAGQDDEFPGVHRSAGTLDHEDPRSSLDVRRSPNGTDSAAGSLGTDQQELSIEHGVHQRHELPGRDDHRGGRGRGEAAEPGVPVQLLEMPRDSDYDAVRAQVAAAPVAGEEASPVASPDPAADDRQGGQSPQGAQGLSGNGSAVDLSQQPVTAAGHDGHPPASESTALGQAAVPVVDGVSLLPQAAVAGPAQSLPAQPPAAGAMTPQDFGLQPAAAAADGADGAAAPVLVDAHGRPYTERPPALVAEAVQDGEGGLSEEGVSMLVSSLTTLHATKSVIDELAPGGKITTAGSNGLVVVERQLTVHSADELPADGRIEDDEEQLKPQVHPLIWANSVDNGVNRLATMTDNITASTIFQTEQTTRRLLGLLDETQKPDDDPDFLANSAMLIKTEKVAELRGHFAKVPAEREKAEMDRFFTAAIRDLVLLSPHDQGKQKEADEQESRGLSKLQKNILIRLSSLADIVRLQTNSLQLRADDTIEAIAQLDGSYLTSEMLEFLTRFEVPPSLAGEIIGKFTTTEQLRHPIAWYLLDRLPPDHPFKVEQRNKVAHLTQLLAKDTLTMEDIIFARIFSEGIISAYVDPDTDPYRDKVGLELENIPWFEGIRVPDGTNLGKDTAAVQSINELRLITDDNVLIYGSEWRKRLYLIHLWRKLSDGAPASLHIHINRNPQIDPALYRTLFGYDRTQVRENELGTVEIKGTGIRRGTDERESRVKRFPTEFMPELVELFYSLRFATPNTIDRNALKMDRIAFFIQMVSDPQARLAMLIAMQTDARSRLGDPKDTLFSFFYSLSVIARDDRNPLEIADDFSLFNIDIQTIILDTVDKQTFAIDDYRFYQSLAWRFESLDDRIKQRVFDTVLQQHEDDGLMALISSLPGISSLDRQRSLVAKITSGGSVFLVRHLIEKSEFLERSVRDDLYQWIFDAANGNNLAVLAENVRYVTDVSPDGSIVPDEDMHRKILAKAKEKANTRAIVALCVNSQQLAESVEAELYKWVMQHSQATALLGYARAIESITDPEKVAQIVRRGMKMQSPGVIEAIGRQFDTLPEQLKTEFFTWVEQRFIPTRMEPHAGRMRRRDTDYTPRHRASTDEVYLGYAALEGIAEILPDLHDPVWEKKIITKIIENRNVRGLSLITANIAHVSDPDDQALIISKAYEFRDYVALRKLDYSTLSDAAKETLYQLTVENRLVEGAMAMLAHFDQISDPEQSNTIVRIALSKRRASLLRSLVNVVDQVPDPELQRYIVEEVMTPVMTIDGQGSLIQSDLYNLDLVELTAQKIETLQGKARKRFLSFLQYRMPYLYKTVLANNDPEIYENISSGEES